MLNNWRRVGNIDYGSRSLQGTHQEGEREREREGEREREKDRERERELQLRYAPSMSGKRNQTTICKDKE